MKQESLLLTNEPSSRTQNEESSGLATRTPALNAKDHRAPWPRRIALVFGLVLVFYLFDLPKFSLHRQDLSFQQRISSSVRGSGDSAMMRVPLEAHIMSKCPDTQFCLRTLVLPAMQSINDKVDFRLSYIGTPTENDGVDCKHGAGECMGNILELCVAQLYPDPKIYLGFTMCLTRDYQDIPEQALVEDCALEHGVSFDDLNACASRDDGNGVDLLLKSVKRSAEAGVDTSCTVRLNNKVYCIRDDEKWRDCPQGPGVNDLVIAVEKLYNAS